MRQAIVSADDFGLSVACNEAIEIAHRAGLLSTASLMVAGPEAADAVARAKRHPGLRVGLHLVVIEGPAMLPHTRIPALVGPDGWFPSTQARLGVNYFARPAVRRQLWTEIAAQFAAFAATGLQLDHANAHKHMHLHPTVGAMLIRAGRAHGLTAIRIPAEPAGPLAACGTRAKIGDKLLYRWTGLLRRQARRAGLRVNDHAFGLAWSGHMTVERVLPLIHRLPPGLSEIYFHPVTHQDALLPQLMPGYEHAAELATLCDPRMQAAFDAAAISRVDWHSGEV